jgi:hypothetical protein
VSISRWSEGKFEKAIEELLEGGRVFVDAIDRFPEWLVDWNSERREDCSLVILTLR